MFDKTEFILFGVIISGVGYLIKRRVESKPQIESLDKHKRLLDIHKQMNEQGIDVEGLRELEAKLTGKAASIHSKAIILQSESIPLIGKNKSENLTQTELNSRAAQNVEKAKIKMQEALVGIDSRVDCFESKSLMNSQIEWERYSVSQAEAAAASYRDGSIYPLIYFSELESLTNERTARLQAELDELIKLGN